MIAIVDYGLGNISAFFNVFKRLNVPATIARDARGLEGASKLILPGVGAFDHAMERLDRSGMRQPLEEMVGARQVPVLGICVGMQILASSSEEGRLPGLGWIPGSVRKFKLDSTSHETPLPHMGWNDVAPIDGSRLFAGLESGARFYFLHSYYFHCDSEQHVLAKTTYGAPFGCAVHDRHIYGVQFHPEKSHRFGVTLLKNFAQL